jgi:hypothetical protein
MSAEFMAAMARMETFQRTTLTLYAESQTAVTMQTKVAEAAAASAANAQGTMDGTERVYVCG